MHIGFISTGVPPFIYFVWISFLACGFLVWYFWHKAKHEERKLIAQGGLTNAEQLRPANGFRFPWLKLGIVIIGLSLGLLIITILANANLLGDSGAIVPAILGLCGGSSMVVAHLTDKPGK